MAITFLNIQIEGVAGGNNSISKNEATKNGFKLRGEGGFATDIGNERSRKR